MGELILETAITYVCDHASQVGVNCSASVFTLTIWHLIVVAIVLPVVGFIIHFVTRYRDISRDKWKKAHRMKCHEKGAVNYPDTLMLDAHTLRDALGETGLNDMPPKEASGVLNERLEGKYFLVQFWEGKEEMFRKELKIRAGWKTMDHAIFRTDPDTLRLLKTKSKSDDDDDTEPNIGAIGQFNIFFRPITNWDARHWLNHPNREIRIGIWVALFATFLEFGPDLWEFLRALFKTPSS